ncbi:polyphosphate polymerase domain-containing protein [Maribacter sp. HTCC2170]|uniref:polyphosphate polymerase domain-containing protein n=1 Tax=Maribacter sp. (strain HTCC2170 / KCCM 42371) TaxID=313603 RepID=UPI00006AFD81|nr:polyphosphate polymerase domain-containing protein [Maribacter sp. HTCC2170]EAR01336.1 hypothetical protein FB2170_11466 [Maribacter sp. HTCC2170]
MQQSITDSIHKFEAIGLEALNSVALMKRTDTKFILHVSRLPEILDAVKSDYRALEIEDNRIMTYNTVYFDTDMNDYYHDHHNGKVRRVKVRKRVYKDSNLCFLEIKKKDGKGRTNKFRTEIALEEFENELSPRSMSFINETIDIKKSLSRTINNSFKRITLANDKAKERVTIDFDLNYKTKENKKAFEHLAIIEVKQERLNRRSPIITALKKIGNNPYKISKYCIGMASLNRNVKYNKFKQKLLKIENLSA